LPAALAAWEACPSPSSPRRGTSRGFPVASAAGAELESVLQPMPSLGDRRGRWRTGKAAIHCAPSPRRRTSRPVARSFSCRERTPFSSSPRRGTSRGVPVASAAGSGWIDRSGLPARPLTSAAGSGSTVRPCEPYSEPTVRAGGLPALLPAALAAREAGPSPSSPRRGTSRGVPVASAAGGDGSERQIHLQQALAREGEA
jgi:hypothetical protein